MINICHHSIDDYQNYIWLNYALPPLGEGTGKPYVPPSEQTVQEPKKYTGGKIPSRSFKVLQAMTGEACGKNLFVVFYHSKLTLN